MKRFYTIVIFMVMLSCWFSHAFAQDVEFRDVNLAERVRAELHLLANELIPKDLVKNMWHLDASAQQDDPAKHKIKDLTGLEHATRLTILELAYNRISDLNLLAKLTNLEILNLSDNEISDISPLTRLTNLELVDLSDNKISDISPLAKLTNLRYLNLRNNGISDVSLLTRLTNLESVYLQGNPIKNIKPLLALLEKNPDVKIYLKKGNEPLPVTLSSFRAELAEMGVVLKWTTESELDNAGFNILRSETKGGRFNIVNTQLIQGAGTTSERNAYTWTDTTAKPNTVYYYRIEDVSHAGVREQLATVRIRGLVSANGKLPTRWAELKRNQTF